VCLCVCKRGDWSCFELYHHQLKMSRESQNQASLTVGHYSVPDNSD
jgi:hypothetical protein